MSGQGRDQGQSEGFGLEGLPVDALEALLALLDAEGADRVGAPGRGADRAALAAGLDALAARVASHLDLGRTAEALAVTVALETAVGADWPDDDPSSGPVIGRRLARAHRVALSRIGQAVDSREDVRASE